MTTQEAATPSRQQGDEMVLFQQLEEYPWDSDFEFNSGLQAILASRHPPEQAEQLTLQARCFYFSRKRNVPIDFPIYQAWRSRRTSSSSPDGAASTNPAPSDDNPARLAPLARHNSRAAVNSFEPPAPYPTSFSQVVELIINGQPIPGIKKVPDTVLEGQATQPSAAKRKKPWE